MADIFREVDEDVRRDRAIEFWKKYQNWLIVAFVIVVAAAGGYRFYVERQRAAAEAAGARYEAALQLVRDNKGAEADAAFQNIIQQGPAGYGLLARFRAATTAAAIDRTKAVSIYDGLAGDARIGSLLQDVARLRAAQLRLDEADAKEIESRLTPLTRTGAPLRNSARELLALAALERQDYVTAGRWLDAIVVDPQAPQGISRRANLLLGLVSGGLPPAKTEPAAPAKTDAPAATTPAPPQDAAPADAKPAGN